MSNIINKEIVLVLNANWQAIDIVTPKRAFVALSAETSVDSEPPFLAMDLELDENGELVYTNPVPFDEWLKLPIRENDLFVQTGIRKIRVPTIIITRNFNKIPTHKVRLCSSSIAKRDGNKCQYTGRELTRATFTLDHIIPRDRGGKDTWENLVACDRQINEMKSNKLPHEVGLKLLKQPKCPPEMPVIIYTDEAKHPSHIPFLTIRENN